MIWATVLFDVVTFRQDYTTERWGGGGGLRTTHKVDLV